MKKALACLATTLLLATPALSWAANRACVIEGSITFSGKTTQVKDCMEFAAGVPDDQIKGSCGGLAQMSAQLGGKPGKESYLPQCPRPASGACKGLMGQPVDAYYYNLTADALQDKRKACETSSAQIKAGTWTNGQ